MKNVIVYPGSLVGEVRVPPSKSLSHRAVICAALAKGKSCINNIILSDDILATIEGLQSMGAAVRIEKEKEDRRNSLYIVGHGKILDKKQGALGPITIDCRESGSTLRFLLPLAALTGDKVIFTGRGRLIERPLTPFFEIFKQQKINYVYEKKKQSISVAGCLQPGRYNLVGDVSSQFITGLLFSLPLLSDDSKLVISTEMESRGYVDLTLNILKRYGINIENHNYQEFLIKGNQQYTAQDYTVEGDFSQAAFWVAAGVLSGDIVCSDLNLESLQGDRAVLEIIQVMGGSIIEKGNTVRAKESNTNGRVIDVAQCPDLVPILAVVGACSYGVTKIINAARLRMKESDRLRAITSELCKLGAQIQESDDGLLIYGKEYLSGGVVESWQDHRIAMALAVAALRCKWPVTIKGCDAVKKSYPSFWHDFAALGGKMDERSMG